MQSLSDFNSGPNRRIRDNLFHCLRYDYLVSRYSRRFKEEFCKEVSVE